MGGGSSALSLVVGKGVFVGGRGVHGVRLVEKGECGRDGHVVNDGELKRLGGFLRVFYTFVRPASAELV
jgi:hypothetical protein